MNQSIALSIKQMEKLESLGLDTSDASMVYEWFGQGERGYHQLVLTNDRIYPCGQNIPAYTLQDILEKLIPIKVCKWDLIHDFDIGCTIDNKWYVSYDSRTLYEDEDNLFKPSTERVWNPSMINFITESPLEASYQMLLWCIENNYIKTNKV